MGVFPRALVVFLLCGFGAVLQAQPAFAALTISKTTWNVIGLDSNNVNTGPNVFPVAAVVCNTGPSIATNLTTTFVWESSNAFINLTGPATVNRGTLAVGACAQAYYWVTVTRSAAAYTTTRQYRITAGADGGLSTSTPSRELYVERLVSQNRNTSNTPSGPTTVVVGQTYSYTWTGNTATQGYEQITNFVTFGDSVFRVLSVQSSYSAGPSPIPGMYNDACSWNDNPGSAGYRTCAGSGKAGGNVTMTVTVQVIGTGSATLAGAIYDFSGSSYHYNSDFGQSVLHVTAIPASADVSVTKTDGVDSVNAGGTTTYTIVVRNAGPNAADGTIVRDPVVAGLTKTNVACTAAAGAVCPTAVTVQALESGLAIPLLPAGGTVTFTLTALVSATSGSVTNGATVTAPPSVTDPNPANNSASDTDTVAVVASQADLTITKTDGVSSLTPGSATIYTVVVTNNGPAAVSGATVTDTAPAGVTFGTWTCSASAGAICPASGSGNLNATVTLPAGGTATFRINATVGAGATGSVVNTASVAPPADVSDPNPANNSATDSTAITPAPPTVSQADLAVTKTNFASTLSPGSSTVYTVVVTNNGPSAVTGVTVTDAAPSNLTFGAWSCTGSGGATCPASGSGNLNATVTLPVGSRVTFQINATVSASASGAIVNTAAVSPPSGTTDPNPGNNSASDTDTVTATVSQADLAVTKTNGASTLSPGANTVYTLVVTNNGPTAVTGATVTDTAPAGLTFGAWTCTGSAGSVCPASGSGNVSAVVTLPAGGSVTFQINAAVSANASGSITNTGAVALPAGVADPNPANNVATDSDNVLAQRIGIAKSSGQPQQIGAASFEIPYTIVVSNIGPIPATNVQVTDALDRTFVTGSPAVSLAVAPTASANGGATAAQCRVNSSFTGSAGATSLLAGDTTLEPGQGCAIALRVRVTYPNAAAVPGEAQLNVAVATTHQSPGGAEIARDLSDSGSDPAGTNPGAPGDTGGSDDPTPVVLSVSTPPTVPPSVVPSDPSPTASVSVAKAASAAVAEIGDVVTYSLQLRVEGGSFLPGTSVEDRLPSGFSYVAGTARLALGATIVRLPDPLGATTRVLTFAIPEQVTNEAVLQYQVRVSAGALQGDGRNCAWIVGADGSRSSESCVRVLVSSSVFTQQACVIGRVFVDGSRNGLQDPSEPGVPGIALYLEDGTSLLTDGSGGFSYCGLRAGTHVLKVDRATLPAGAELVSATNRNALDGGSAFLDVKFGEVHRVDFVVAATGAVMADVDRRRAASRVGTLNVESTPSIPNTPTVSQQPFAVGIVEGIVSLTSLRRPTVMADRPGDVFDEELRRFSRSFNDGKGVAAGRAALFMQGTVKQRYRLSVSFDSERPDRGVLFRDIQPDAFYPIYGDASQKRFDAQTSRRFYARIDRGPTYLLYGDLVTTRDTPARDLGVYARTLTGVQHRFEKQNVVLNVFATRDTLRQVIDEVGGRGTSGPYSVSNRNGVSGTEKVEIITRDRNQPAVILSTQLMTRFLDYEFEPFSGRVLFRRPIPSMDEHMNPVSVRITYEVDGGGERHWVDGFDGRVKVGRRVEVGGSWAQDRSPVAPYDLASANATVTFGAHTTLIAEAARSSATVNTNPFNQLASAYLAGISGDVDGNAARVELTHAAKGLRARAFAGMSDATFHNPSATLNGGRAEAGVRASYQLRPGAELRGELIRSSDRLTGGDRTGGLMALESKFKKFTFEAGLRHVRESAEPAQASSAGLMQPFGTTTSPGFGFSRIGQEIDPVTGMPIVRPGASPQLSAGRLAPLGQPLEATTIRARLSSTFGKAWNAYVEGEQDVTVSEKRMAAAGAEYRAADRARLYLRHEYLSGLDGIYSLREGQRTQRTVFGLSSTYTSGGEVFSEYRMNEGISGREAQAAIGLRNVWKVRDGVRLSTSLERLNPIRSVAQAATAATFGAEVTRNANFKGSGRLEWRREAATNSWLSTGGIARRLSQNWTMLAKNYYQITDLIDGTNQVQDRFWVGAAYRDSTRNRRNLLSRYEFRFEQLPNASLTSVAGDRRIHVVSTHGDYRRSQPWTLSGQYAGKWVHEELETGRERYAAHLVSGRTGYDITRRIDVGGLTSIMWSGSDGRLRKALGAEVGFLLRENTWLSVGYNVTGFSDRDFNSVLQVESTTRGFFIRLRMKFDEELFRR